MNIIGIQNALKIYGIEAWLLTDWHLTNIPAIQLLKLDPARHTSRRWFYLIPQAGQPIRLVHSIEARILDHLPGKIVTYSSRETMIRSLREMLHEGSTIAMEYSPMGRLPNVSRIDAGTLELIRSLGVDVVSSANLLQQFTSRWDDDALASHRIAAGVLRRTVSEVWDLISENLSSGALSELEIQQFMMSRFAAAGCITDHPPIVAIDAHAADPHFAPHTEDNTRIGPDQLVLLDLWCRVDALNSIYADITWTAWTGPGEPGSELVRVFDVVLKSRDTTVNAVKSAFKTGQPITGAGLDRICRRVITDAGYGDYFIHRTGHSLDTNVHGAGANLDSIESEDEREIAPCTGFTIEPGIYLPGRFGIRSELNVAILKDSTVEITGMPVQTELLRLS